MKNTIISTSNPSEFIDLFKKYCKKLKKENNYDLYIDELVDIMLNNKIGIHNGLIISRIIDVDWSNYNYYKCNELSSILEERYLNGNESEKYWIVGLLPKLKKRDSYQFLINVINGQDKKDIRANAMKQLAIVSKQPFDKNLPKDPGNWKEEDIRIDEINLWIKGGYKEGDGYLPPKLDNALVEPKSDFENIVFKLNNKLKKEQDTLDYSSYDNYLVIANLDKLSYLISKYNLDGKYLEFLKRFSPCNVIISKGMYDISLYGVDDLEKSQVGYSVSIDNEKLAGWPDHYLVIADRYADPYCINTRDINSKIYLAHHGEGNWEFKKAYNSFEDFLMYLAK